MVLRVLFLRHCVGPEGLYHVYTTILTLATATTGTWVQKLAFNIQNEPFPKRLAMAVACGVEHTVMVAEEGRAVLACGRGYSGQLGNGTREQQRVPGPVSGLAEVLEGARVVMVAAGGAHSAASTSEGEVCHGFR